MVGWMTLGLLFTGIWFVPHLGVFVGTVVLLGLFWPRFSISPRGFYLVCKIGFGCLCLASFQLGIWIAWTTTMIMLILCIVLDRIERKQGYWGSFTGR